MSPCLVNNANQFLNCRFLSYSTNPNVLYVANATYRLNEKILNCKIMQSGIYFSYLRSVIFYLNDKNTSFQQSLPPKGFFILIIWAVPGLEQRKLHVSWAANLIKFSLIQFRWLLCYRNACMHWILSCLLCRVRWWKSRRSPSSALSPTPD